MSIKIGVGKWKSSEWVNGHCAKWVMSLMLLSLNQHRLFRLGAFRIISGWDHFSVHHPITHNEKILLNRKITLSKDPPWMIPQALTMCINSFLPAWEGWEKLSPQGLLWNVQQLWISSALLGSLCSTTYVSNSIFLVSTPAVAFLQYVNSAAGAEPEMR